MKRSTFLFGASSVAIAVGGMAGAATIDSWNLDNVVIGATDGTASASVVYNGDPADPTSTSSGRISYAPPEATDPGIKVQQETYKQGGKNGLELTGCVMTSNMPNPCTGEFQSGKRVKAQMTGLEPIDLVFDVSEGAVSNYQMFYRLINQTTKSLAGFALELGFGVGNEFVQATADDGITFSTAFRAQPAGSGASSTTQYPFGLFGDAASSQNFDLDGFFAPERSSLSLEQTATTITSTGFVGPYNSLFPAWLSQENVPLGAFWDNDGNEETDALLMAWLNADNLWEVRRDVLDMTAGLASSLLTAETFQTFEEVVARLGLGTSLFDDIIEDLANLNVNFAFNLTDSVQSGTFTLRTTALAAPEIVAPVPLPASAPLMFGGLAAMGFFARRKRKQA